MKTCIKKTLLIAFILESCFGAGCGGSKVHLNINHDFDIKGITLKDAVRLKFRTEDGPNNIKSNSSCGYELTPAIWKMNLIIGKKDIMVRECQIPPDHYILLELDSKVSIEMGRFDPNRCNEYLTQAAKSIDDMYDTVLYLDDERITDIAPFRHEVIGCPEPFYQKPQMFAGEPSNAIGYFVLLDPLSPSSKHNFTFSATKPCWFDLLDYANNICTESDRRRTIDLHLTIGEAQ